MRAAAAIAALAIVPLLAGCTGGDDGGLPVSPAFPGVPAAGLSAGGFFAFAHGGGPLVFALDGEGSAAFDLYDGADRRLGSVGFTSETSRTGLHRIEGVGPGDLVLRVQTLDGTLHVDSGGQRVAAFQPLGRLVERVPLLVRDASTDPTGGFLDVGLPGFTEPADVSVELRLPRTPVDLRVLATGPWTNLSVEVRSDRGIVLRTAENVPGPGTLGAFQGQELGLVASELTPQNLRDGALSARVRANDLAGAVVLEAESYSRAPLPTAAPGLALEPAFTYGALNSTPAAFTVHRDATRLVLWQDAAGNRSAAGNASVAVFGPGDERIATVLVPTSGAVALPVARGGEYVAVLLGGQALLGADRAPADFELRPLEVRETTVPAGWAGEAGRYGVATESRDVPTAFAFAPAVLQSGQGEIQPGTDGCDRGRYLRIDQAGEAVLVWEEPLSGATDPAPLAAAALALGAGQFTVAHDGFGDDRCTRPAVAIRSYVRAL